jgi:hypothetical protein
MRVALVLLLVVGCAAEKKAANEAPAGAGTPGEGASNAGSAAADTSVTNKPADEQPKLEQGAKTGGPPPSGGPDSPPPPPDVVPRGGKGGGGGSAVDAARSGGMLGPSDQRAFQTNSKVSIKSFSSKDLDAAVKPHLDAVQTCYDKALEFADKLAGELTITVKDGKPTVTKSTVKNADLEKCVVDALALAALPKPKATLVLAFKRE